VHHEDLKNDTFNKNVCDVYELWAVCFILINIVYEHECILYNDVYKFN